MFNSFLKNVKSKKTTLFLFLLFFIFIAIVPSVAFAAWWNPLDWLGDAAAGFFNAIVAGIFFVPLFVTAVISDLCGVLLQWAISGATVGVSYTHSDGVKIGWPIVRDFANMIIVLGFVVIGIATALRFKDYEAKQLLKNLIIAALLVNFSLLICGIAIDATNIPMSYFFSKIGNAAFFMSNTADTFTVLSGTFTDDWKVFAPKLISMLIFNIVATFVYLLYIILLLGRIVALWCLVILSPLAFVCAVFPVTRGVWQMWQKNFIQWCIIGIPAGLFYFIGSQMMAGIINVPAPSVASIARNSSFSGAASLYLSNAFSFLLPELFLVVGFFVSLQFASMMGGGLIKGAGAKLQSGMLSSLKGAAALTGATRLGAWGKDKATAAGERLGLVSKGTTSGNQQKRLAEATKRIDQIKDNDAVAKIASQTAITHEQALDKAAAAQVLAQRKAFDKISAPKQEAVVAHAVAMGVSKDTFTRGMPGLSVKATKEETQQQALENAAKAYSLANPTKGVPLSMDKSLEALKKSGWKANANDLYNATLDVENRKQIENTLGLSPSTDADVKNKLIADKQQEFIDSGFNRADAAKQAQDYAKTITQGQIVDARDGFRQGRINKGFSKADMPKILELSKEAHSTGEFGANARTGALIKAMEKMSGDTVANLKKAAANGGSWDTRYNDLFVQEQALRFQGKNDEADKLLDQQNKLFDNMVAVRNFNP